MANNGPRKRAFASSKFSLSTYFTYSGANGIDRKYIAARRYNSGMKRALIPVVLASTIAGAQSGPNAARARDIFKQLIEINTTDSVGNVSSAAEAVASRLKAAGFPASDVQVLGPDPRKHNVVARYQI